MKGWFTEMNDLWAGQAMSLEVDEILHHEKSQYQDILVFNRQVCVVHTQHMHVHVYVCVLDSMLQTPTISIPSLQLCIKLSPGSKVLKCLLALDEAV